jgi:multidrug efflux pump subunit AcrB
MTDVDSNYNDGMPELQVTPDRAQAALHGVSIQSIGKTVNAMIGGVKVGQYPKDGYRYDIRVQVDPKYDRLGNLKNLTVGNARGNLVPLSQLVKQEVKPSLQQISRIDRQRAISMFANLKAGASQEAALDLVKRLGASLPNGYSVAFAGSAKSMKESFESLVFALVMGILVAYMILAAQFNSFIDPLSVLVALPFSVSGAFIGLLVTGNSINMYSMIGLILLMGIVKKNSILLVEFANQIRAEKDLAAKESLISACPVRLRPILMTSFATIVGALPEAVSFGAGGETMRPMAVAVIGGVFVSTLLTLYVVPSVYLILSRFDRRTRNEKEIRLAFEGIQE